MKNASYILFLLLLCAAPAFGGTGTTAASSPEGFTMASGSMEGTSYLLFGVRGDRAAGIISGETYVSLYGFPSSIYAPSLPGPDLAKPSIQNIKFDGNSIRSGDYANSSAVITARVSDESGIDSAGSSIEVDGVFTPFSSLTGASAFSTATGDLSFSSSFAEGTHTLKIYVRDLLGNSSSSETITFIVKSGSAAIEGSGVLNYPNPFSPPSQTTKISYMLNTPADVKIYIFNMLNQLVKKFEVSAGSEGGHAGYNQVEWNGISDFGEVVPNDVYFCKVVSGTNILGKCKIAVLR